MPHKSSVKTLPNFLLVDVEKRFMVRVKRCLPHECDNFCEESAHIEIRASFNFSSKVQHYGR